MPSAKNLASVWSTSSMAGTTNSTGRPISQTPRMIVLAIRVLPAPVGGLKHDPARAVGERVA